MSKISSGLRVVYSVYLALLFNSGSILIFDWWKSYLPESPVVRASCGFFGSFLLLLIGKKCYDEVDPRASIVESEI